ncbi:TRAP transporter small permease subunit [Marinobacter oulmenensis]|uniref:TRAP transporter small permease protein n=1 Tax=Marinobacter oulmenensis TaxID=643747 RepID=A0A840UBV8_9GAMM|nr:TRAP transporter small permease subunit [Marinobacter oulmenensis]MBB5319965.1 TRAP-type mannitol/chloroaromatic compound transport system permease small subunit [Marinobacter oulmenensis]
MAVLLGYCRLITAVNRWLAGAVSVLVFVMVAVISYEVVARYFFDAPTVWAMELSTLLFGPYFLLAGPYLLHTAGHVNVDILHSRLPKRTASGLDCLTYGLIVVVSAVFIYQSLPVAMNAYNSGETSFTAWNPAIWPVKVLIPVAFFMLLLQALAESIEAARRALTGEVSV